jgi:hypothetical protein
MKNIWFAVITTITLLSCGKENPVSKTAVNTGQPVVNNLPVTITLNQSHPGYIIPENFEGLSYETGLLVDSPGFLDENNRVLIRLIKNLGTGVLRVGGNSSDLTNWAGNDTIATSGAQSLTAEDIGRLSAFDKVIGWQVLFGLNLGSNNPVNASNEAKFVHKSIGDNLYAFQSGNEPDVYFLGPRPKKYNYDNYQQEWATYFSAIRKEVPGAAFAGPDVTPYNAGWITSFAQNEDKNIKLIDGHYYAAGPASDPSINYQTILAPDNKLPAYLGTLHTAASQHGLHFRISECNSIFGGGKHGVSDVFASALWALDFMWEVAEYKGEGVNFHGGRSFFVYSPIAAENGTFTARPLYYGMLAFKYGAVGQAIIPVKYTRAGYNISAHACVSADSTYTITLINKEVKSSFSFVIQLEKTATNVRVARLTAQAITSVDGITFANSAVNTDGGFKPAITEQYPINQNSFIVNVPAGSAAIVMVR